jgi:YesN/AraC family two-component response regulator
MKKINVLLVEDDPLTLELTAMYLEKQFNIFKVSNGLKAWNMLELQEIHCLVTDIDMPIMNGLELIEKTREANYDIATIVVSGNDDPKISEWITELKVDAYLSKPYQVEELQEMIKNLVK